MAEPVIPMLGDLELKSAQAIETSERRALVEHRVPGMAGSVLQDLGRPSTRIALEGLLFGEEAKSQLEGLRAKFQEAAPLSFTADIATATEIVDVVIADLQVSELAGRPNTYQYRLLLAESPPPPPPLDPLAGVDLGILADAQGLFDQALGLTDLLTNLGNIPDFGDPTKPLTGLLDDFGSLTGGLAEGLSPLADLFGSGGE